MGEVYRARDTKLDRGVAIKVLPSAVAQDPERLARFEREAKVLAALNHPNIAQIYGVEQGALVMELVDGENLSGPVPLDTALDYARQIADALEAAHEKGIVHRDLKPANIKVTPQGVIKVLDFGLAAVIQTSAAPDSNVSQSPTLTLGATQMGVLLGTAAYMAPEQARGKPIDKRADIWAFGVVLYEVITGRQLFRGEDISHTLAAVIMKEPDLEAVPPRIRRVLQRCLEKDPRKRLRDISSIEVLLEEIPDKKPAADPSLQRWVAAGMAAAVTAALAFGWVAWRNSQEPPQRAVTLFLPPPEKGTFPSLFPALTVSPDGRRVAFEAVVDGQRGLWVRELDNPVPRMLSDIGGNAELPFWAPDSRRLGFFSDGRLKTLDISGGPPTTLADAGNNAPESGSWNQDDVIVFGTLQTPLYRISAAGGSVVAASELDSAHGEAGHFAPWFLPDGHHFLYVAVSQDPAKRGVYVGDLTSKTRKRIPGLDNRAIYVKPGYVLYLRDRTLLSQPFDTTRLEMAGNPTLVAQRVGAFVGPITSGHFSSSQNGVLAYASGSGNSDVQLTWFDHTGKKLQTVGAPGLVRGFSLSPDDTKVAVTRGDSETGYVEIWIRDLVRGSESRLLAAGSNMSPAWSADGARIYFRSTRDGVARVYQKAANNTGPEEVMDSGPYLPSSLSPDGRYLFAVITTPKTSADIWVLPLFGNRKAFPYVQTEFQEIRPRLSPDGRWLAYQSNESKRVEEAYVISFPQPGAKWQISNGGGAFPTWSRDGRELYYYSRDQSKVMAVDIRPGAQFQFGMPKALFEVSISVNNTSFEVSQDGRFLLPVVAEQSAGGPMTVVLNWPEMLKKR